MNYTSIIHNDPLYFKILEIVCFSLLSFFLGVVYGKYCFGTRIN